MAPIRTAAPTLCTLVETDGIFRSDVQRTTSKGKYSFPMWPHAVEHGNLPSGDHAAGLQTRVLLHELISNQEAQTHPGPSARDLGVVIKFAAECLCISHPWSRRSLHVRSAAISLQNTTLAHIDTQPVLTNRHRPGSGVGRQSVTWEALGSWHYQVSRCLRTNWALEPWGG